MRLTTAQEEHVRALIDQSGRITPDLVIEDARIKSSPLHDLFEWDKGKAAYAHWRDTARAIMGAVKIQVTNTTTTLRAPMLVRDPDAAGEQGYRSVVQLRTEPEKAREAVLYTLGVAEGHLQRAYAMATALGLASEFDQLLDRVTGLQRAVREAA